MSRQLTAELCDIQAFVYLGHEGCRHICTIPTASGKPTEQLWGSEKHEKMLLSAEEVISFLSTRSCVQVSLLVDVLSSI